MANHDYRLTAKDVAEALGVSDDTARTLAHTGAIKAIRPSPRRIRFSKKSLEDYIKSREIVPERRW